MSEHDPYCGDCDPYDRYCHCSQLARARADERERIVAELDGPAQESEAMYAHAEAVAARLVEVVCEQERTRQIHVETIHALSDDSDILRAERDAARPPAAARQLFRRLRELLAGGEGPGPTGPDATIQG